MEPPPPKTLFSKTMESDESRKKPDVAASCGLRRRRGAALLLLPATCLLAVLPVIGGFSFAGVRSVAWVVFGLLPLVLAANAVTWLGHRRLLAAGCALAALVLLVVSADAFLLEPRWLEVTVIERPTAKIERSLRIAVVADLQTDHVGAYEDRVIRTTREGHPDLVLLCGDYVTADTPQRYQQELAALAALLRRQPLSAPLGVFAIEGNVEHRRRWQRGFAGTGVRTVAATRRFDLGPLILTCLSLRASFELRTSVATEEKLHIVVGHAPDFALGQVAADLLIAGHTHGGQVRLPFFGPLITLSQVPRSWAHGATEIRSGTLLVVSRGIGMERGSAPRLRFLCRPQLVFIDLQPVE